MRQPLISGKVSLTIRVIMDSLFMDMLHSQIHIDYFQTVALIIFVGQRSPVGTTLMYFRLAGLMAGLESPGLVSSLQELLVTPVLQKTLC
jgi:hypothetical protein